MSIFICDLYSNHGKNRPNMPLVEGGMKMRYVQNFYSMVKLVLVGIVLSLLTLATAACDEGEQLKIAFLADFSGPLLNLDQKFRLVQNWLSNILMMLVVLTGRMLF